MNIEVATGYLADNEVQLPNSEVAKSDYLYIFLEFGIRRILLLIDLITFPV